jgi:DNA polymerase (family 10)
MLDTLGTITKITGESYYNAPFSKGMMIAQPIEVQTDRLIKAAQSVDIIFHPIGRIINKREGYPVNVEKLINIAKETNTILEVDAYYDRLDLKDDYIRMAVQNNVNL